MKGHRGEVRPEGKVDNFQEWNIYYSSTHEKNGKRELELNSSKNLFYVPEMDSNRQSL